jgi:hypothetical protein
MSPNPSDVGTSDMYPTGEEAGARIGDAFTRVVDGVRAPDEADGWVGILLPAIVTGLAIEAIRRAL